MPAERSVLSLIALLLVTPVLTGCLGLGGDDGGTGEEVQKQRANVDDRAGGIEGVVTDDAIQPVTGANVTLVETDETVQTAGDGSFAFSLVAPGTYTVSVTAPGFLSAKEEVTVQANQASAVDFIINHLVSQQAFTQQFEFTAFIECALGAGFDFNGTVGDPPGPVGQTGGITWATCSTLNLEGNTTNDRFLDTIELEAPIETLVWEASWDPSGNTAAENLWFTSQVEGFAGVLSGPNETFYEDISVDSPLHARIDKPVFQNVSEHFQAQCEDGSDAHCGYNFWDRGWPITIRVFTAYDCLPTPVSGCAPVQMQVDNVFTAFYNAPAPDGFSVLQEGEI